MRQSYLITNSHFVALWNRANAMSSSWKILEPAAILHLFPTVSSSPSHCRTATFRSNNHNPPRRHVTSRQSRASSTSRDIHQSQRSLPSRDSPSNHFHSIHSAGHRQSCACLRTERTSPGTALSHFFPPKIFSSTTLHGGTIFSENATWVTRAF
jgi:hypothetical protein